MILFLKDGRLGGTWSVLHFPDKKVFEKAAKRFKDFSAGKWECAGCGIELTPKDVTESKRCHATDLVHPACKKNALNS